MRPILNADDLPKIRQVCEMIGRGGVRSILNSGAVFHSAVESVMASWLADADETIREKLELERWTDHRCAREREAEE